VSYIENPKTAGSGILCAIPQRGRCPVGCADCFFQSGRSFLEPLEDNLPNLPPPEMARGKIVRMNDGNDSNNQRELVIAAAEEYEHVFFNTSMPKDLAGFDRPVVLTVNPGKKTDRSAHLIDPVPTNLMFVRFRVNTWNLELCDQAVEHYTERGIPVMLTFMRYYTEDLPEGHAQNYAFRKKILNHYWDISTEGWDMIMSRYVDNNLVYSCGRSHSAFLCSRCGGCLREYFATVERMERE